MTCLCFHRDLTADMITGYKLEGGTLWAIYRMCPTHGCQAVEPVRGVGVLETKRTAVVETAVSKEF